LFYFLIKDKKEGRKKAKVSVIALIKSAKASVITLIKSAIVNVITLVKSTLSTFNI